MVDEDSGRDAEDQALRDRILEAALPNIAFDGWSRVSLEDALRQEGLDPPMGAHAFPGGIPDLVDHFADWADRRMLEALPAEHLATLKVRERIAALVRARLEVLLPHREALRQSVALTLRAGRARRLVWSTADRIWRAAGDTATDFNHYTKRGLLAGVLVSTTLYWLNDRSDAQADSWAFLDRRIGDVLTVFGSLGRASRLADPDRLIGGPLRLIARLGRQGR